MPRGNISYIDVYFCTFFLCTKGAEFFFLLFFFVMCTMSANFNYIYWPVGAKMKNYILIKEYLSFTKN